MESDEPPIVHQCPICRNEYVEPKITPCGHSFCKRCLQSYEDDCTSRGGQTLSNVVCPLCKQLLYPPVVCPSCKQLLPIPDGVDSLPTNRSTVDIINAHRRTACPCRRNLEKRACDICLENSASLLACEAQECASDGLRFCETCARDHVGECGHKAIGLCESHDGKPLRHFCTSSGCNVPICVTCRKVEHSGHDVRLHRDVIAKEVRNLESGLEAGRQRVTQLDEQKSSLSRRVEESKTCVEELNSNLTEGIDHAIEKNKQAIREREAEIQLRVEQIRENTDQNRRLSVIKESLARRIEAEHSKKLTDIESSVSEIEFVREKVTAVVQRGEDLIPDGVPMTSSLRDDIRRTSEHLLNQLMTSQRDWATPLLESKNFDVEGVTELVEDLAVGADTDRGNVQRERIITMADAGLEYFATDHNVTPVRTYESSRLPDSHCKCDVDKFQACLVEVKSVVLMSKDRLAVCCVTASGVKKKKQNIWLWESYTYTPHATKPTSMMSFNAKTVEYQYMTKRGENELILLRRMNPVISILDIDLRATRKLNVNMPKDAIDGLWQVDVDNDGHFLLSFFTNSEHKITLLDNDGNLLSEVICQNCEQLAFSQLTREVITCSFYDDMISVYGVHGKGIGKRLSYNGSSPHDIFIDSPPAQEPEGLICTDICVGSLGDIFVVGRMRGDPELKGVYMIILSDDSREVERWEELYQMRSQSDPRCSVYNNRLVISDGHKIRLFYLR